MALTLFLCLLLFLEAFPFFGSLTLSLLLGLASLSLFLTLLVFFGEFFLELLLHAVGSLLLLNLLLHDLSGNFLSFGLGKLLSALLGKSSRLLLRLLDQLFLLAFLFSRFKLRRQTSFHVRLDLFTFLLLGDLLRMLGLVLFAFALRLFTLLLFDSLALCLGLTLAFHGNSVSLGL